MRQPPTGPAPAADRGSQYDHDLEWAHWQQIVSGGLRLAALAALARRR